MTQSVETTIRVSALEDEISRLRLIIGDFRDELQMWREDPDKPYLKSELLEWQSETDKLMYGD